MAVDRISSKPRALIFDLMGTCLDWHTSILPSLSKLLPAASKEKVSQLALNWRQGFFDEIHARFEAGEPQEDIDVTHMRILKRPLKTSHLRQDNVNVSRLEDCVSAWHSQKGSLLKTLCKHLS